MSSKGQKGFSLKICVEVRLHPLSIPLHFMEKETRIEVNNVKGIEK